ncbi:MAG: retropepsin-like aspartic protease, partial [Kiritimatiellae bacterium]|nr:retropepsin-like aspartic protease [Kiritimatiellia bacterium]
YYPVAARPFFDRAKALENLQERIEKQDRVVQQIQADHHRARSRTQKEESRLSEIEIQLDATNVDTLQRGTPEYPKRVRLYNQHVTAYNLQVKEVRDATATLESTETDLQRAVDSKNQLQTTYNIRARKLTEDWKKFLRAPSSGENQDEWGKHLAERIHRFQAEPILQGKTDHIRIEHLDRDRMRVTVTADRNGQFILPVLLNQKTNVRLLLDTGATSILLHRNVANRADVHTFNTTQKAQVADGRMVDVPPGVLEELDIFGQHFQSVSIDVIEHETDADIDGLLGMSILKQFEFSIFQDTLTLTVSPESGD